MMKNAKIIMKFIFCCLQLDASVAQVVEQQTSNQKFVGSCPTEDSILLFLFCHGFTSKPDHGALSSLQTCTGLNTNMFLVIVVFMEMKKLTNWL